MVAAIRELGGSLRLHSEVGKGTRFTLFLPNPSPVLQVELYRIGNSLVAVPPASVVTVRSVDNGATTVEHAGEQWPFADLSDALGIDGARAGPDTDSAVLLRSGMRGIAVRVDEVLGKHENAPPAAGGLA